MKEKAIKQIKSWIWIYFLLLIFEGALRKWVLPGLAQPLLLIRDPFAIMIIYKAIVSKTWVVNSTTVIVWYINVLGIVLALLLGHGSFAVALFGFRIFALHFPLIFIIGKIYDKNDVLRVGKAMLWINIFMTLLIAVQFFSPQTAWVNRGIGGDIEGSGFEGDGEFMRVPGLFSFTNGLSLFYGFAVVFVCYFWFEGKGTDKKLLILSTVALIAALPLSISRTVFFEYVVTILFLIVISGKSIGKLLGGLVVTTVLILALGTFSFFQTANQVFINRFDSANKVEGGVEGVLIDRFLGGMYSSIVNGNDSGFFGKGLGMGTNAGAKLLGNTGRFLISEGEWGRLIGEMGIIFGLILIIIRFSVVITMVQKAYAAARRKNILPWMLSSFAIINVLQGQWAQPTALGFAILAGGLAFAAVNISKKEHVPGVTD